MGISISLTPRKVRMISLMNVCGAGRRVLLSYILTYVGSLNALYLFLFGKPF